MAATQSHNFRVQNNFEWTNGIKVSKYQSSKTGITVVLADIEGPLVEGAFVLSTEAHDDFGCPHTLEHLIFMGSELYPYKGILDGLANRSFAQGTNAWTDTDHTAYTLTTAGAEGFLNLLPVFLDHILYATITEESFHTEVHHITGAGRDAGVVYCEMEGRENSSSSRLDRRMMMLMYPEGSGYRSETGGKLEPLRHLTVQKVREWYQQYYHPGNLCLIISGKVPSEEVFTVLDKYEQRILEKGALKPHTRPWTSPVPPFTQSVTEVVPFPSDDEETGTVLLAWRGPAWNDFENTVALDVLWQYLTDSAVAPLQEIFVEIEDPYCNDITPDSKVHSEQCYFVEFENAPKAKIPLIKDLFFESVKEMVAAKKDGIDMDRMTDVIEKEIRDFHNQVEEEPHAVFQHSVIGPYLYGNSDQQFQEYLTSLVPILKSLLKKKESYWKQLLKKYIVDAPYVCLQAVPSIDFAKELQRTEEDRVHAQVAVLGEAGLKALQEKLDAANTKNNIPVPVEIFKQFKIPDVNKVPFIPVETIRNDTAVTKETPRTQKLLQHVNPNDKLPFFIQFDHISSAFVEFNAYFDASNVDDNARPLLELYLDLAFELPITTEDGEHMTHEEVVSELEADSVSYSNAVGFGQSSNFLCGAFSQVVTFTMKFEVDKYSEGAIWMHDILWNTQFTPERLRVGVAKLAADIAQYKRKGDYLTKAGLNAINFDKKRTNHGATNLVKQQKFLQDLHQRLESDEEAAKVCQELDVFHKALCHPKNMRVQVVCDLTKVQNLKEVWHDFLPDQYANTGNFNNTLSAVALAKQYLSQDAVSGNKGFVVPVAAIDSAFLLQSSFCPPTFLHEDEAPLMVLNEYLCAMEGAFWKQIRGLGLSYSYSMRFVIEEGRLYFSLFKSTDPVKAYEVATTIVNDLLTKKTPVDETFLEGARSGTVYAVVSKEDTYIGAAGQAIVNYFKGLHPEANRELLARVQQVTVADIYRVLDTYVKPLFNPQLSNVVITANPLKVPHVISGFAAMGRTLKEAHLDDLLL